MKRTTWAVGLIGATITLMAAPLNASTGIDGVGKVGTCPTTGKIQIKPPLKGFPSPDTTPPATVSVQSKGLKGGVCSGTRTGDGAHIIAGQSKGSQTTMHSSCSSLGGTSSSMLMLTVKWKTDNKTKLNPSTVSITSQTGGQTSDGHGSFDITGTVTAGSFNGDSVTGHIETDQLTTDILAACNGKGLKKITFGLNGKSTTTIQ